MKDDKSLKDKAVDIRGKQYVLVSDRVLYFNGTYPKGCIVTELLSGPDEKRVVFKATVYPDGIGSRYFTGYSQAVWGEGMVNKTAALENAETSAVGRALAFMGIGVIDSVASVDEIHKATDTPRQPIKPYSVPRRVPPADDEAGGAVIQTEVNVDEQKKAIAALVDQLTGKPAPKVKAAKMKHYTDAVFDLTGLNLEVPAYGDIIDRLEALKEERKSN